MPDAFGGLGTGRHSQAIYAVASYLAEHGQASRSELLRQHRYILDSYSLGIVLDNLREMHLVARVVEGTDQLDPLYRHLSPGEN